jgi:hypothetical protein
MRLISKNINPPLAGGFIKIINMLDKKGQFAKTIRR